MTNGTDIDRLRETTAAAQAMALVLERRRALIDSQLRMLADLLSAIDGFNEAARSTGWDLETDLLRIIVPSRKRAARGTLAREITRVLRRDSDVDEQVIRHTILAETGVSYSRGSIHSALARGLARGIFRKGAHGWSLAADQVGAKPNVQQAGGALEEVCG